jgi:hypothetical protein
MRRGRRFVVPAAIGALVVVALTACDPVTIDQRAIFTTQSSVTITGTVAARNGDPLTSVDVNGAAGAINGTGFSAVVIVNGGPAFVAVLVTAHFQSGFSEIWRSTVAWANGSSVTLLATGAPATNAIATVVRPTALTKLGSTLVSTVSFPTSAFAVPAVDLGGDIFDAQVLAGGSTTLSTPTVALDASTGTLRAVETYTMVHQIVPVLVQGFTGPQNCTLDITFSPVTGTSTYSFATDPPAGFRVSPAASPSATSTITGTSGCTATNTVINAIPAVSDYVQTFTQQAFGAALSDPDGAGSMKAPLAAGLEQRLAALKLSGPIGGGGSGVTLTAPVASIGADANGIAVKDTPTYAASSVAAGAPTQSSSLAFGALAPALASGTQFDSAVGASVASVNQLLAADTERGQLNRTVTTVGGAALTYNKLDTLVGLGGPISPDRAVQVAVGPELAPAVTEAAGSGNAIGIVHLGGLRLTVTFTDNGAALLDSVVDADGQAQLQLSGGNVLLRATSFTATRRDVLANPQSLSVARTNGIVAALMADLTAPLGTGVALFPAPVISGLTYSMANTGRTGSGLYIYGVYS